MQSLGQAGVVIGGIGLFLLGMWLMTEGLTIAAGSSLRTVLARWTRGRLRPLLSGIALTAAVQSSSAVTVATIGFVNTGLLNLTQASWIIFGTNVGTTMTGWFVALVGLQFKIEALALPLIGIGMGLRLTGSRTRHGALGQAMAGFGVFFLGIDTLRVAFASLAGMFDVAGLPTTGHWAVLAFVGIGIALTVVTQSSSAAIAIILTAAAGGAIPLQPAAACVIGANIGTTSTAILAVLGATPNARRVAAAHVIFNVLAAVIAIGILPWMVSAIDLARRRFGLADDPAVALALFHTAFNLLGVAAIWFASRRLIGWLSHRFVSAAEEFARPRYLDANLATVPALALRALVLETQRLGTSSLRLAARGVPPAGAASRAGTPSAASIDALARSIRHAAMELNRGKLPAEAAEALPALLRATQHYESIVDFRSAPHRAEEKLRIELEPLWESAIRPLASAVKDTLALADTAASAFSLEAAQLAGASVESAYQTAKGELLAAGAAGELTADLMDGLMEDIGNLRRVAARAVKAAARLEPWLFALRPTSLVDTKNDDTVRLHEAGRGDSAP
jgi:phosphate:Na+ symporter